MGSPVGPAVSSSYDHGHSGLNRQAPGLVSVPGEARRLLRLADGQEGTVVAPSDAGPSSLEGYWRARTNPC